MFFAILILLFIVVGLGLAAVWANFSIAYAIRYKERLHKDALYVKLVLISVLIIYGLVLGIFLVKNTGSKRSIIIENKIPHGVIIINKVKYPTYFRSSQANIIYHINNPIDYLFLNCDVFHISYTEALLRVAIVILLIVFLWRFNFDEPFQWEYYNRARRIWVLILLTAVLEIVTNAYSNTWVRDTLNNPNMDGPRYHYLSSYSQGWLFVFIIVISSLFYLYGQAIRNREEIDLTI